MRDWLAAAAEQAPDSSALLLSHDDSLTTTTFSYAHLNTVAAHQAECLANVGVQRGDTVATLMQPSLLHMGIVWATARVGAVLVPLNLRLTPDELRYQVESVGCKVVICDPITRETAIHLHQPKSRRPAPDFRILYSLSGDTEPKYDGVAVYIVGAPIDEDALPLPALETPNWTRFLDGEIDLGAVQSIIFTSGTSGKPKAAQITFGNLYHSALASAERLGASPDDRWLCPLPFYHVGGLSIIFRSAIYGSSIVLPESTTTEGIIKGLHDSQATIVSLVPTQLYRILEAGFEPPSSLRLILVGGAAASPELVQRCIERNLPISLTYGLTECASQVATAMPAQVRAKPGSVGKPLNGTAVRIVDDEGYNLSLGVYGEIVVSGDTVMKGYLGQTPTNGTFHTGDIGYLDADGDLWVVQRRSDLIVSGGENVYPAEVEAVLRQHPAVEDACVVGVPDAEWGQRVVAMVALKPGITLAEADLIAFSRERLAGYKQPRSILFVEALPQTASGKVRRRIVQEMLSADSSSCP